MHTILSSTVSPVSVQMQKISDGELINGPTTAAVEGREPLPKVSVMSLQVQHSLASLGWVGQG